ncbi:MAG TPA: hypothetical protein DDX39_01165 [Bacteroidales bacterium]|nr:hypothetical protein [Bacteroidales bacterium]
MKNFQLLLFVCIVLIGTVKSQTSSDINVGYNGNCTNGYGTYLFEDGTQYVGLWKNGKYDGHGIYYHSSGEKYIGEFADYKYNGFGIYNYEDGSIYKGYWKDGVQDGPGIMYNSIGEITHQGIYFNGEFINTKEVFNMGCYPSSNDFYNSDLVQNSQLDCTIFNKISSGLDDCFTGLYEKYEYDSYSDDAEYYSWKANVSFPPFEKGSVNWDSHHYYRARFEKDVENSDYTFFNEISGFIKKCCGEGWTECYGIDYSEGLERYYKLRKGNKYIYVEQETFYDYGGFFSIVTLTFELNIHQPKE